MRHLISLAAAWVRLRRTPRPARRLGIVEWVTLGAIPAAVPHTRSVPILGTQSGSGLLAAGVTRVAESGIRSVEDIHRLRGLGYHACLIGERFMTAPDPGAALAAFLGNPEGGA